MRRSLSGLMSAILALMVGSGVAGPAGAQSARNVTGLRVLLPPGLATALLGAGGASHGAKQRTPWGAREHQLMAAAPHTGLHATRPPTVTGSSRQGEDNQPPVAGPDYPIGYTDCYHVLTVPAPGVLENDYDPEDDPLTAVFVSGPEGGASLTLNPDGSFTFDPPPAYDNPNAFRYQAVDCWGACSEVVEAEVMVTTLAANPDEYTVNRNDVLTVEAPGVLGNDLGGWQSWGYSDPAVVTGPQHGVLTSFGPDGSFIYQPDDGFHGTDSFTYKISDWPFQQPTATVSIVVNAPPMVVDDQYAMNEGEVLSIPPPGVLANDIDADGDPLTAVEASGPSNGSLTLNGDGSFTYQPEAGFNGTDEFLYDAHDPHGGLSGVAQVTIVVAPANSPPTAADDSYSVNEDNLLTITAPGVLANDTDADGDPLTGAKIGPPSHGIVRLHPDGSFTYRPVHNYNGSDSFTYRANDGTADSNDATVTITVNPVNDPPKWPWGLLPANRSTGVARHADLSWNCSDPDGDALRYAVYLGTTNPPPVRKWRVTTTTFDPGLLRANTRFYWRIEARDRGGLVSSSRTVWFETGTQVTDAQAEVTPAKLAQVTGLVALPARGGQTSVHFTLSTAASVSVRVLNAAGRPVRTVCLGKPCEAGTGVLLWDGRADNGLRAPDGIYLVQMTAAGLDGSRSCAIAAARLGR